MTGHLTIGRGGGPTAVCSVGRLDRARTAALAGRCLLWAGLVVPGLCAVRLGLSEPRPVWQQAAGAGVLAAATALARRRPLAAFALTAALCLADAPALFGLSYGPALAVFALLLGLRAERTGPAALGFAAVASAGTVRIALGGGDPVPPWLVMTGTLVFGCVLPWLGGRYWRQSRELTAAGRLRAARLEEEQRLAEERARLRERARIAQDMHDSLGPELSLLALRAAGLQVAPDLPERHRVAVAACARRPRTPRTGCTASSACCARTTTSRFRSSRPGRPSDSSSPAPPAPGCRCAARPADGRRSRAGWPSGCCTA
ncbi:histidine kinase [Streptomyces sp. EMB24]|uniref:histidine kinase n=1 Tax=Streptomyces sp. EMB24 TaxID=2835531 RepID=UPI00227AFB2C|nr:histidine kinase [Streptomyces sp. EMB24]